MSKIHRFASDDPRERALAEAHGLITVARNIRQEGAASGDTRDNGEAACLAAAAGHRRHAQEMEDQ